MAEEGKKITTTLKKAAKELMETLYSIPSLANLPATLAKQVRNLTQKKAEDKGLPWINQIHKVLGKVPHLPSIGAKIGAKLGETVKDKKAKGGIVQKFSKGGTVERPRGVGIAKKGYGKVMR